MNTLRILLALAALSLSAPASGEEGRIGVVAVPLANVRSGTGPKSPLVTQVLMGEQVELLEKLEYRYRISIPGQGNAQGWIHQEALLMPRPNGKPHQSPEQQSVVVVVPKTRALILDPLGNHNVSLYAGTRLPAASVSNEGVTVLFPDRTRAVIAPRDVAESRPRNPLTETDLPGSIARAARSFAGTRGKAGGMTAQGIDMGGLIHVVYRMHGIPVGRSYAAFAAQGVRIDRKSLQAGDILVFHGDGLGLFVGNGKFLRTEGSRPVALHGIHDRRFANSLRHGIRIAGADPVLTKLPREMTDAEILAVQTFAAGLPLNRRIAYWAGRFIGTPYDPDPLGLYVRTNRIVADEQVDCMYHTFRSVELALTATPREAIERALDLRFRTAGRVADGLVQNYDERFEYGEDMVFSGKWGRDITAMLGRTDTIPGSRGRDTVAILPKGTLETRTTRQLLHDGDIVFWVKDPKKRMVEEIVAHLSIVRLRNGKPYLVHAAGNKDSANRPGGGVVKEVPFDAYVRDMRFIGAFVTRFGP